MDIKSFEDTEQERFLNKYYGFEEVKAVIRIITREQYPVLREKTKKGLEDGVEDFLKKGENKSKILYLADIRKFAFDNSTENRINKALEGFELYNIKDYAKDVCEGYRMFVYQDSINVFEKYVERRIITI